MPQPDAERETHPDDFIAVGRVIRPSGLRGEVEIDVLTDFPDRFDPGNAVHVQGRPLTIERSRSKGDRFVLKLSGIDTRSAAEELRGILLEIPLDQARQLPPGEFYRWELVGVDVWSTDKEPVGRIIDILPTGSNDVYVVSGPHGEVLIPAIDDVIQSIDTRDNRMVIRIIDGLLP